MNACASASPGGSWRVERELATTTPRTKATATAKTKTKTKCGAPLRYSCRNDGVWVGRERHSGRFAPLENAGILRCAQNDDVKLDQVVSDEWRLAPLRGVQWDKKAYLRG